MLRKCTECGLEAHTEQELDLFKPNKKSKHGRRNICKKCSFKVHQKPHKLKKFYGITPEELKEMFDKQKGCCKVCGKHQTELDTNLCVDHCHTTGKVRGLLCKNCNLMLGHALDNQDILLKGILYLKENNDGKI